jgi:mono/diheme cytochrome c family protein
MIHSSKGRDMNTPDFIREGNTPERGNVEERMKLSVRGLLGILSILILVACTPNAETYIISPGLGAQVEAELAGQAVQAAPTPAPRLLAELTPEEIYAGLPQEVADAIASADPARGEQLTQVNACVGCHSVDPTVTGLAGPNWSNVGNNAANRVPSMAPAHYLYESIANPNAYVVPGFPSGVMPQNYAETFSAQDFADIIAYLLEHTE